MAVTPGSIPVTTTGKNLDTTTVTTTEGTVHREGVFIADAETAAARANVLAMNGGYGLQTYTPPFDVLVSAGLLTGWDRATIAGFNPDVDASSEDIWANGGLYVLPTTARVHSIVSSSANDTSGGTGCREVRVYGLNGSYARVSELVTMGGTSPVTTSGSFTFIEKIVGTVFGSGETNAGAITATAQVDATVSANMPVGAGSTSLGLFMVPAGYTGFVRAVTLSANNGTAGTVVTFSFRTLAFGAGGRTSLAKAFIRMDADPAVSVDLGGWVPIPEKTLITTEASSSNNNSEVAVFYTVLLKAT